MAFDRHNYILYVADIGEASGLESKDGFIYAFHIEVNEDETHGIVLKHIGERKSVYHG